MKQYIKDLTPEMIISRLKNGEVLKNDENATLEMIDGFIIGKRNDNWCINPAFGSLSFDDYYFEIPEPELNIEIGKFYKTREGEKAYVFNITLDNKYGVVVENKMPYVVSEHGFYSDEEETDKDLVELWEKEERFVISRKKRCDDAYILELINKGKTYEEIVKETGCCRRTVAAVKKT